MILDGVRTQNNNKQTNSHYYAITHGSDKLETSADGTYRCGDRYAATRRALCAQCDILSATRDISSAPA